MKCLQTRWKNFSTKTSILGFNEIQRSKSKICSFFWLLLIALSIGITIVQIEQSIHQYLTQYEAVSVQKLKETVQVEYPDLQVCYQHWLYWARLEQAIEIGFTKESVLFGLSYLTDVFSVSHFNTTKAKEDFTHAMQINNFTVLSEFYTVLARATPEWENRLKYRNRDTYFEKGHFMGTEDGQILYCYKINGDNFVKNMEKQLTRQEYIDNIMDGSERKFTLYLSTDHEIDENLATIEEYKCYIARYVQTYRRRLVDNEKLASINQYWPRMPIYLYTESDINKPIEIEPDCTNMFIEILIKVHEDKNSQQEPCLEDVVDTIAGAENCRFQCLTAYMSKKCSCPQIDYVEYANSDYPEVMCTNEIYIVNEKLFDCYSIPTHDLQIPSLPIITCNGTWISMGKSFCCNEEGYDYDAETDKCLDNCKNRGCIMWVYRSIVDEQSLPNAFNNVTVRHANKITLSFPMVYEIDFDRMVYMQTLDNLIGNVGGLMGIWIGASITSLFQLVYLCCCSECAYNEQLNKLTITAARKKRTHDSSSF